MFIQVGSHDTWIPWGGAGPTMAACTYTVLQRYRIGPLRWGDSPLIANRSQPDFSLGGDFISSFKVSHCKTQL